MPATTETRQRQRTPAGFGLSGDSYLFPPEYCGTNIRLSRPPSESFKDVLFRASTHVGFGFLFIFSMSFSGLFDSVYTDTSLQHYAEKHTHSPFPKWFPMPLNSLINMGYVLCGVFWLFRIRAAYSRGFLSPYITYLLTVFSVMSVVYGPVQLARILLMTHTSALIDQWVTLPFFMWVVVLVINMANECILIFPSLVLVIVSLFSYSFTLLCEIGFEIALTLHISSALGAAFFLTIHPSYSSATVVKNILFAIFSCAGFVVLKVFEHQLARYSDVFTIFSGHFLSKIADVLQIHFVLRTFEAAAENSVRNKST